MRSENPTYNYCSHTTLAPRAKPLCRIDKTCGGIGSEVLTCSHIDGTTAPCLRACSGDCSAELIKPIQGPAATSMVRFPLAKQFCGIDNTTGGGMRLETPTCNCCSHITLAPVPSNSGGLIHQTESTIRPQLKRRRYAKCRCGDP